jgi:hypothetical protein
MSRAIKIDIRHFPQKFGRCFLEATGPLTIVNAGATVGYFIPERRKGTKYERKGKLAEFLASSPMRRSGLKASQLRVCLQKVNL